MLFQSMAKKKIPVKLLDLAVLLLNVHRAAKEPAIGFEDANRSLSSITRYLNKTIQIEREAVESALWSSNMLNEDGKFWHPHDETFDVWAKKLMGRHKFDSYYGTIEMKED